jgi:two-component system cell cycle sensor histidine kinase/response regulator CckA
MRGLFTPPFFEGDEEKTSLARRLNIVVWFLTVVFILYTIGLPIVAPQLTHRLILLIPLYATQIVVWICIRRGQVRLGSAVLVGSLWLIFVAAIAASGGVRSPIFAGIILLVLGGAALFGRRFAFVLAGLSMALGLILVWAEDNHALPPPSATPLSALLAYALYLVIAVELLHLAIAHVSEALERARREIVERERAESERAAALEALRESEGRLSSFMNSASDSFYLLDSALNFVGINDRGLAIIGKSREDVIGKNIVDIVPDVKTSGRYEKHLEVIRTGQAFVVEHFVPHPVFGELHFVLKSFKVGDGLGVIASDITERKRAEEEIRRLNQFLDGVIDNADIWLDVLNEKAEVVLWNKAAEEMSGYSREEVTGHGQIWQWLYPDEKYRDKVVADAMAIIKSGRGEQDAETTIRRKDGQTRVISWNSRPLVDETGSPAGSIALGRDITEHKRAEEARLRLATAIDQAAESIVITDTAGTIQYVNPAFERITGYSQAEAIGENPRILKSGKQDAAFYEALWATITAGQVWQGRLVNRKKDGSLYTEDATISPVREGGAIINYVAVKRDVTRELQLEEQYYQAQKMEAVGRLTAGVAHDFNNILTAINGFSELVSLGMAPDDPLQDSVKKVLSSGQRAAGLVRQLLAFSRKQIVQPEVLDLNDVLANVDKMLRRIIGEDVELQTIPAPGLWLTRADPVQVEQIILNLAVNARDAMPDGGKLTIETANVTLDEAHLGVQPGEYVLLAVSDTGTGLSEEVKSHLFEPFFTTKELGRGTGLGLATVYGIVKQSGGDIQVYSEEGVGTTFKVYLPRAREVAPLPAHPQVTQVMPAGDETILLVEDDEGAHELARRVLGSLGYTLLEARNGPEALRLAADYRDTLHLLLTDVVLPGMSGKALAEQLARSHPGLKTLFMSGYTDNAIAHHGVLDPGTAFLQKPFGPVELARKVRAVLDAPSTEC